MSHNVSELFCASMAKVRVMVDANTVVGTPISTGDGTTLIPISKISFAMASGGSDLKPKAAASALPFGGGAGCGVKIVPVAFLVLQGERVRMLPLTEPATSTADRLIEQILQNENAPQTRLYLLNQYLENFKGTVYRQTMFAEFEREAHAMVERGEALNASALNALYKRLVIDYFGDDMVIDDESQYEWARIPHFYRPFYVYKYATGYSTAVALSEGILKEGEPAVKRYKEFLSMGGSAYPLDELRHAGVDLATPAPVDAALEKFERILDDAEAPLAKLQ